MTGEPYADFDQGYQHWHGELYSHATRWFAIAYRGVINQWKNRWVRRVSFTACAPALVLAFLLSIWGLIEQKSSLVMGIVNLLPIPDTLKADPSTYRTTIWTLAFFYFFNVQTFFSMVLVLLVGPDLISQDLRFNAIPLYFSKPIRRIDYFLGKLAVIGAYLATVTIIPVTLAYCLGLLFSFSFGVLRDTYWLFFGSIAYSLLVIVSAGTLMLAISSLSRNSRHVSSIGVGFWIISGVMATALTESLRQDWCPIVSYGVNLHRMRDVLLDTPTAWSQLTKLQTEVESMMNQGSPSPPFGPRGPIFRGPRGNVFRPAPGPPRPPELRGRDRMRLEDLMLYQFPWQWSAGVLAGLFGLSVCILSLRVRSLDRLR